MEPIDLVMKIWSIQEHKKSELVEVLAKYDPMYLEVQLTLMMQNRSQDDFDHALDAWVPTYMPGILNSYRSTAEWFGKNS